MSSATLPPKTPSRSKVKEFLPQRARLPDDLPSLTKSIYSSSKLKACRREDGRTGLGVSFAAIQAQEDPASMGCIMLCITIKDEDVQ